jgi:hypothetical protein
MKRSEDFDAIGNDAIDQDIVSFGHTPFSFVAINDRTCSGKIGQEIARGDRSATDQIGVVVIVSCIEIIDPR